MSRRRKDATEIAVELVNGERQDVYGDPLQNHERIAAFWNVRLGEKLLEPVTPFEVAACMRLVKEARLMQSPGHRDSLVDIGGYANVETRIHEALEAREEVDT